MNILGISGSPREKGNSEILLEYALKPFKENGWTIETLRLSNLSVKPCQGCDFCIDNNGCIIDDDMEKFYGAFNRCNAIIISSPVYYRTVTAQLLSVFHRYYAVKDRKLLECKPGGAIAVGRSSGGGGQSITINQIYTWMLSCGVMAVPGELNGLTAAADKPGDILKQEKRLLQAEKLGKNILKMAVKLNS
jgi:multimeric flavodoxin WrbA